jgi:hypothetical protein
MESRRRATPRRLKKLNQQARELWVELWRDNLRQGVEAMLGQSVSDGPSETVPETYPATRAGIMVLPELGSRPAPFSVAL